MANKKPRTHNRVNAGLGTSNSQPTKPLRSTGEARSSSRISPASDLRKLSEAYRTAPTSIAFGNPSGARTTTHSLSSGWTSLLSKTASGGFAGVFGGGLLGLGLQSLFSGITDLFGHSGQSTPASLQTFSLPSSQQQTIYYTSDGLTTDQVQRAPAINTASGVYGAGVNMSNQAAIVNAVRNALLTSSSLNDVIGEL